MILKYVGLPRLSHISVHGASEFSPKNHLTGALFDYLLPCGFL